jgi:hypothetical protein
LEKITHSPSDNLSPFMVFFEGLPREPERVPAVIRSMGADHVVLISGQRGWEAGHRALATRLNREGIATEHVAADFGHYASPEKLKQVLGTLPERW